MIVPGANAKAHACLKTKPCTPGKLKIFKTVLVVRFGISRTFLLTLQKESGLWTCFHIKSTHALPLQHDRNVEVVHVLLIFNIGGHCPDGGLDIHFAPMSAVKNFRLDREATGSKRNIDQQSAVYAGMQVGFRFSSGIITGPKFRQVCTSFYPKAGSTFSAHVVLGE